MFGLETVFVNSVLLAILIWMLISVMCVYMRRTMTNERFPSNWAEYSGWEKERGGVGGQSSEQ